MDSVIPRLLLCVMGTAALLFIGISATMNALFLSSLGRTALEAGLLGTVSVAADMTKAALPVVLVRAVAHRAWGQATAAALMLASVTALSLASGTGFAVLTREAAAGARATHAERIAARRRDMHRIEARLDLTANMRGSDVLSAELAAAMIDRRWQYSNGCAAPASQSSRAFCGEVLKLKGSLAGAQERDQLEQDLRLARAALDTLLAADVAGGSDQQATAIAAILGIDRALPRVVLASSVTVILELGSVLLVLLAGGSVRHGANRHLPSPSPSFVPAEVPPQTDRSFWLRHHGGMKAAKAGRQKSEFIERDAGP